MEGSRREIEVKLPFDSASEARAALLGVGARPCSERSFEDNQLFDFPDGSLDRSLRLLRLRRTGSLALLTFKAPVEGEYRHKVRLEEETAIQDPDGLERILAGLGFRPTYRYQKYRTEFEMEQLQICLDETPLGVFVELEGQPDEIDRVAALLGYSEDRYVCESYRVLHENSARQRRRAPGDMVFVDEADKTR